MLRAMILSISMLAAQRLICQPAPSPVTSPSGPANDEGLGLPSIVAGQPPLVESQGARSNYLTLELAMSTGYDSNVLQGETATAVADMTALAGGTIEVNRTTPRLQETARYSTGFNFYRSASALDAWLQDASLGLAYRVSRHATINIRESLDASSSAFGERLSDPGGTQSGGIESPAPLVIAPFGNELGNTASVDFGYQTSRRSIWAAGGTFSKMTYTDVEQLGGINNSQQWGGFGLYHHQLSGTSFIGSIYQYAKSTAVPISTVTETHGLFLLYSTHLGEHLVLDLSTGPQYLHFRAESGGEATSWSPALTASADARWHRIGISMGCSRLLVGGGGLSDAYRSTAVNGAASMRNTYNYAFSVSASYMSNSDITRVTGTTDSSGHVLSAGAHISHPIGSRVVAETGFAFLRQEYAQIAIFSNNPDVARWSVGLHYQFARPLGR